MSGKKDGKKAPSAKKLEGAWRLRALSAIFKASCLEHNVPLYKPMLEQIEELATEFKPLNKLCFQGADIRNGFARVLSDCMAGYPDVKNLCFWGCAIGDEGLTAISDLLRASSNKYWQGSKLKLVEITHDMLGFQPDLWKERHVAMVEGTTGLVTPNHGLQMPSWVMGTAPALSEPLKDKHTAIHRQERQASDTVAEGGEAFGLKALRSFALAISIKGSTLSVLVLDHNHLGDGGVEILAAGLQRAASLKSLSLAYCGIGPGGASRIASTMVGDLAPKYEALNLQGNDLGGRGLQNLCEGVKVCSSLKSLNLSSIGVTDADKASVEALVKTLALNTSIIDVDFSSNSIGDRGGDLFLPLLAVAKHIKVLRLTPRVSRSVGKDIYESVKLNSSKKSSGRKGTKKKKK